MSPLMNLNTVPAMKFALVTLLLTASSFITAQPQHEEEEVDISGCLAPISGRATFTVVGQQGVKGSPGPEGPQGPSGVIGLRGEKGLKAQRGMKELVCEVIQVCLVPSALEGTLVQMECVDHLAFPVHQDQGVDQVHQ